MGILRVTPVQGQDRVHVFAEGTDQRVAWFERSTGRIEIEDERYRDAVLDALAPYLRGESPPATPTPIPRPRRPGQAIRSHAEALVTARGSRLWSRLTRTPADADPDRAGAGDLPLSQRLARLSHQGWQLLHGVRLGSGTEIDHVAIGPAGVFTVNAQHHPGARVCVGTLVVSVDGRQHHYMRHTRDQAIRAAKLLSVACGFPVSVTPVLAFLGAASVKVGVPSMEVLVLHGHDVDRVLHRLPAKLPAAVADRISAAAHDQQTWLSA